MSLMYRIINIYKFNGSREMKKSSIYEKKTWKKNQLQAKRFNILSLFKFNIIYTYKYIYKYI